MRFLAYADLQASEGTSRCFWNPQVPLQRWRVAKFYAWLYKIALERAVDGIIDGGDTMDRRDAIAIPTIHTVLEGVNPFAKMTNFRINGNHDTWSKSNDVHNGRMFDKVFRLTEGVEQIRLKDSTYLTLASFPPAGVRPEDYFSTVVQGNGCFIGHFTVKGAKLNSGTAEDGIPLELLRNFELALLGDIHKPQTLVSKPGHQVHYIGSPFQQDFGEEGEAKRVALIDTEACTVEWIEVPGFPIYRTCGFEEFTKEVHEGNEDRFCVLLTSAEEAAAFYAHPLAQRAEPRYMYAVDAGLGGTGAKAQQDWHTLPALRRYIERNPPKTRGVDVDEDTMYEFGKSIAVAE